MSAKDVTNYEIAYQDLSDAELVERLGQRKETAAIALDSVQRMEYEVIKRLEELNACELSHPDWDWECRLAPSAPCYDTAKLYSELGENVEPAMWRHPTNQKSPRLEWTQQNSTL